jgi:hypothetical protein
VAEYGYVDYANRDLYLKSAHFPDAECFSPLSVILQNHPVTSIDIVLIT